MASGATAPTAPRCLWAAAATGVTPEVMREDYIRKTSLRRMVTAQDVAAVALFLCSPAARNITGQAVSVDANTEYL